jgi:hypothetical protein
MTWDDIRTGYEAQAVSLVVCSLFLFVLVLALRSWPHIKEVAKDLWREMSDKS